MEEVTFPPLLSTLEIYSSPHNAPTKKKHRKKKLDAIDSASTLSSPSKPSIAKDEKSYKSPRQLNAILYPETVESHHVDNDSIVSGLTIENTTTDTRKSPRRIRKLNQAAEVAYPAFIA